MATILDATSGARIGPSPANRAIFHRNFNHVKEGKAFTGGVSWLEEYRAMQVAWFGLVGRLSHFGWPVGWLVDWLSCLLAGGVIATCHLNLDTTSTLAHTH